MAEHYDAYDAYRRRTEWQAEQQREAAQRANDRFDAYDAHRQRTERQSDRRG